ncbi:MAG: ATPase, T2SS/T4P/T4SS family [Anaerorhabdus sp.]|uniref:ATPase, T2SS/T4P/T4SS family n=1 Tax=Anaerorhabdus sp. TaxID=1872524 RepID=UPI002FCB6A35
MEKRLIEYVQLALHYQSNDIHFSITDSDILIELKAKDKLVRFKPQDDDLRFFRYLQFRANLDLGNTLMPQTGRFDINIQGEKIALRFAVMHSLRITSGVLRILNAVSKLQIQDLSNRSEIVNYFKNIENQRNGLFIFSGPTGSGKTTTLYTILNQIKNKKIYTLEDPIEVYNQKYVQLQINEKQALGYNEGIKQLLRHAPDIIMIGEIRDEEAAKMAIRCALTGHLVLTTIHAGHSYLAIERLIELGVSKHQLKDVLRGISNQRLYNSLNHSGKICLYEIMQRKEIVNYLETGKCESSKNLQTTLQEAIRRGEISIKEAKQDFDES